MNKKVDAFVGIALLAVWVLLLCGPIACSEKNEGESMFVWVPTYAVNAVWPEYLDSYKPGSTQTVLSGPGAGRFPSRITEKNPVTGQEEELVFLLVPIRFLDIGPSKENLATPERHGRGSSIWAFGANLESYGIRWTDFKKAMQSAKKREQAKNAYRAARTAWTGTGSGIALANVLARVQQITAYAYQMTMTVSGKAPTGQDINQSMEGAILMAQDYGMKMIMEMADPNGGEVQTSETYMLPQERAMISLMPATKQYMRVELDDTLWEKGRQQNYDPGSMLKQILDCKYESLGRSVIDGVEAEGFRTTDPKFLAGMRGQADVTIWVDIKTQLPVRSDMDMRMGDMQVRGVIHNFQWDYPVTAADFTPVIPPDYTTL